MTSAFMSMSNRECHNRHSLEIYPSAFSVALFKMEKQHPDEAAQPMQIDGTSVSSILTRTSGYLSTVASHSLQPYRGCSFGNSLCGVGCYVQHNGWVMRGQAWGSFLEARINAADVYRRQYERERAWARRKRSGFGIFMSSSTDPFVPQEDQFRITRSVLEEMIERPPDFLILQTHTHRVTNYLELYPHLSRSCAVRFHVSIESDVERLPGLPPPASTIRQRMNAAKALHEAGLRVIVTVSPLFPMRDPRSFFQNLAEVADGVVIDHFIQGDGTPNGSRTTKTRLPAAMQEIDPNSTALAYRDRIVEIAREVMPGRVGVSIDGFAGRFLGRSPSSLG